MSINIGDIYLIPDIKHPWANNIIIVTKQLNKNIILIKFLTKNRLKDIRSDITVGTNVFNTKYIKISDSNITDIINNLLNKVLS